MPKRSGEIIVILCSPGASATSGRKDHAPAEPAKTAAVMGLDSIVIFTVLLGRAVPRNKGLLSMKD